jgi:hypothetical protein
LNTIIDNNENKNEIFLDFCNSIKVLFKLPNELLIYPPFLNNYLYDDILYYNYDEPNYFKFYRNKNKNPTYVPIRLLDFDGMFISRDNDGILDFDESQIREIINIVKDDNSISKIANTYDNLQTTEMKETVVTRSTDETSNTKTISYD